MARVDRLQLRLAGASDAEAIAALHADNWRRHYRGTYSDAFLDGDVAADRRAVWTERLREPDPAQLTILAEDSDDGDDLLGFAHTIIDDHPTWGALLDNLHVAHGHGRLGIGTRLLARTAEAVTERAGTGGLYLWVLEQNVDAQAFYQARGGRCVERGAVLPPGGIADRLSGPATRLRYIWPDPAARVGLH